MSIIIILFGPSTLQHNNRRGNTITEMMYDVYNKIHLKKSEKMQKEYVHYVYYNVIVIGHYSIELCFVNGHTINGNYF